MLSSQLEVGHLALEQHLPTSCCRHVVSSSFLQLSCRANSLRLLT